MPVERREHLRGQEVMERTTVVAHSFPDRAPEAGESTASERAVQASEADVHLFGLVRKVRRDWFGWWRSVGW